MLAASPGEGDDDVLDAYLDYRLLEFRVGGEDFDPAASFTPPRAYEALEFTLEDVSDDEDDFDDMDDETSKLPPVRDVERGWLRQKEIVRNADDFMWLEFCLNQIKVPVAPPLFSSCQLLLASSFHPPLLVPSSPPCFLPAAVPHFLASSPSRSPFPPLRTPLALLLQPHHSRLAPRPLQIPITHIIRDHGLRLRRAPLGILGSHSYDALDSLESFGFEDLWTAAGALDASIGPMRYLEAVAEGDIDASEMWSSVRAWFPERWAEDAAGARHA